MGFGFLSMTARAGVALDPPVDVFVHQVRSILVTLAGKGVLARASKGGRTDSAIGLREIASPHCAFLSLWWHPSSGPR